MSITRKRVTAADKEREKPHAPSRVHALKSLPFAKKSHLYNECHSENVWPVLAGRGKVEIEMAVVGDVGFRPLQTRNNA